MTRGRLRIVGACLAAMVVSACGLGELGASAAAGGASKAEEAKRATEVQAQVEQRLEEAAAEARKQREAIEAATQ